MKLITFQSTEALKSLINNGYLICDENYINKEKAGPTYDWVINKMNNCIKNNESIKYPIWCWVKCYNGICPPKVKGEKVKNFDIKITFNKKEKEVFITDFRRYSFILNNIYIPDSIFDKEQFEKKLSKYNISHEDLKAYVRIDKYKSHRQDKEYLEICDIIKKSFDKCITKDSNILQGCVWKINLEDIEKIEFIGNDGYRYGSLNYIRSNGKRIDWQEDFYNILNNK